MWLNAPANHGLAKTGKPPQLVNMFPHYLAMSEIPKESTHHLLVRIFLQLGILCEEFLLCLVGPQGLQMMFLVHLTLVPKSILLLQE